MYSRRDFGKLALAGVPLSLAPRGAAQKKINSTIKGVQLGAQTYSFRNLPLDGMIQAMVEVGLAIAKSIHRTSSRNSAARTCASGVSPCRSSK